MHPREGDEELSVNSKDDPRAAGGRSKSKSTKASRRSSGGRKAASDVGRALRSVYDTTLREEVPRDFLDLLSKLD